MNDVVDEFRDRCRQYDLKLYQLEHVAHRLAGYAAAEPSLGSKRSNQSRFNTLQVSQNTLGPNVAVVERSLTKETSARPREGTLGGAIAKQILGGDDAATQVSGDAKQASDDSSGAAGEANVPKRKRRRGMLGVLAGHLTLARKEISRDKEKLQRRERMEARALQHNQEEMKRGEGEAQARRYEQLRSDARAAKLEAQAALLRGACAVRERAVVAVASKHNVLQQGIVKSGWLVAGGYHLSGPAAATSGRGLPPILWKPAIQNDLTRKLSQESARKMEALAGSPAAGTRQDREEGEIE